VLLAIGLGFTAAFLYALAASLQQHEAHEANPALDPRRPQDDESGIPLSRRALLLALAQRLPRSRLWRLGWAINLAGFLAQGAALYAGSVALVQPLLVTQLLFALPLTTWWVRRWPSRRDWLSGGAICAGVALFLVAHGGSALRGAADRDRIILAGVCAAVVVAALVRLAASRAPAVQAVLVSIGAGLCFAMNAPLMKLTAEDLVDRGVAATAVDWPGYALAVPSFLGVVLVQWAFATGSLPTAVAIITITNPLASYLIGILAFDVVLETSPTRLAALATAGTLTSLGVLGLAHSSIVWEQAVPTGRGVPRGKGERLGD
jgi:drug/metabolite transporter (DMT)-like permease